MAENTSMTGQSGLGLKPVAGPQGLKIATSVFTAKPDESVEAVDAYDAKNPGVINNMEEDVGGSGGLFDGVKNAIAGAVGNLGIGDIKTKSLDLLKSVKSGTSLLKQVTSVASRAQSAMNQISKGGVMGSISGLSGLASMGGVSGAFQLANQARGVMSGIQQGGVGGLLRAGGAALGGIGGGGLSQLAGNLGAIERLTSRNGLASGGLGGILSTVDSSVSIASATIGSLDKVSQVDFSAGFDAVMKNGSISGKSLSQSTLGRVYTAVGDLTGAADGNKASASLAGVASGLVTLGSSHGDNSIYSLLTSKGLNGEAAFTAGTAISGIAASSGNLGLLADVSSTAIGSQAIASNPMALRATIMNLTPDVASMTKPLASVYDQMDAVSAATGQNWKTATRSGSTIMDASACKANDYAVDVLAAKSAQDNFKSERLTEANATKADMTESQYLYAAAIVPNAAQIKIGDKDYDNASAYLRAKPMTADLW